MITVTSVVSNEAHEYESFLFNFKSPESKYLFTTTDISHNLFEIFLNNLPVEHRQHYTCHACKRFIETYGGLVTISDEGKLESAVWPSDAPEFFRQAMDGLRSVAKLNVTGVFYSDAKVWGQPVTGEWHHMAIAPASHLVYSDRLKTPAQAMAEKAEDYKMLWRSLNEFPLELVNQAMLVLKSETLQRNEKVVGVAEWLHDLQVRLAATKNSKAKSNLVWLAVASAPTGYCHVRSSMIGTLLDDLQSGMAFAEVKRRFDEKMHPLQYQRPQAAPTVGNIEQAEKIVEKLGLAASLKRRFARLDEVQALWKPKTEQQANAGGVFGHLKAKTEQPAALQLPPVTLTWEKFQRTVMPLAEKMELFIKSARNSYGAFVTAVDMDAPPILQWDSEAQRNPVSWYLHHNGSSPAQFGLVGSVVDVTAICYQPNMWNGGYEHQGVGAMFLLKGAKDLSYQNDGLCLFPECLRSELREIRSTIEAYSKKGTLEGFVESSACGLLIQKGSLFDCTIRVTTAAGVGQVTIDRWD